MMMRMKRATMRMMMVMGIYKLKYPPTKLQLVNSDSYMRILRLFFLQGREGRFYRARHCKTMFVGFASMKPT
jgi:hypothetical protein